MQIEFIPFISLNMQLHNFPIINLKFQNMDAHFDNYEFLKNIGSDASRIAQLKSERNWAIGISLTVIIIGGLSIIYYFKTQDKEKNKTTGNSSPTIRSRSSQYNKFPDYKLSGYFI